MKPFVIAALVCVLGAVGVTSCALGMYLQSSKSKTGTPAAISELKNESRHDTAKELGRAAASDPLLNESLDEALREREITLAKSAPPKAIVAQTEDAAANAVLKKHQRFIDDALFSLAKGEIEDAKLSLDLAISMGLKDPEPRALQAKVSDAIVATNARLAQQKAQAQQRKKAGNAGDVNPFD